MVSAEDFPHSEYDQIYEMYTNLAHLRSLLKDIEKITSNGLSTGLSVRWIEGTCSNIAVNLNGWFSQDKPEEVFPTFESLCMRKSLEFNTRWGQALFQKLQELDEEENCDT